MTARVLPRHRRPIHDGSMSCVNSPSVLYRLFFLTACHPLAKELMKIVSVVVVLAVGAALGVVGARWYASSLPLPPSSVAQTPSPTPAKPAAAGVLIEAVPVRQAPVERGVSAVGTLRSDNSVMLRPEVAGRIAQINFEEGGRVRQGDILLRLDDSVVSAQLQQAKANLALAESRFRRAQELSKEGFISQQARDEAASELQVQRAAVALAQAQLQKTVIEAPFGGLIGLRNVSVGDYVSPGTDLVTLESIDPLKVDFRIPEQFLGQVFPGLKLSVAFDALPGQSRQGEVGAVSPLVDVGGRSILLRATVPNPDDALRPGMFSRVRLQFNDSNALTVPETALAPAGTQQYVFVVRDGIAHRQAVKVGVRRDGWVEIEEGLAPDDMIVTAGLQKISDGAKVRVQAAPANAAATPS